MKFKAPKLKSTKLTSFKPAKIKTLKTLKPTLGKSISKPGTVGSKLSGAAPKPTKSFGAAKPTSKPVSGAAKPMNKPTSAGATPANKTASGAAKPTKPASTPAKPAAKSAKAGADAPSTSGKPKLSERLKSKINVKNAALATGGIVLGLAVAGVDEPLNAVTDVTNKAVDKSVDAAGDVAENAVERVSDTAVDLATGVVSDVFDAVGLSGLVESLGSGLLTVAVIGVVAFVVLKSRNKE